MNKISAVIIARNEEKSIGRTLSSLDFCDEIVVVDSGSTDATVSICEKHGCRLFSRAFDGFGPQKRFAVSQAANDWVLAVDADEVVTEELRRDIVSVFSKDVGDVRGFFIPISLVFFGRLLRFGGEYKKPHLRLFHRGAGTFTADAVHEYADITGKKDGLNGQLIHHSYDDMADYFAKFNAYTSAAAQALFEKKRGAAALQAVVRFPLTFVKIYLLKGCFLDGYPGFVWSLLSSLYAVVKFVKLRELYSKQKEEAFLKESA
jgi:glycosyltransferase involved in cell wall biosynthesis